MSEATERQSMREALCAHSLMGVTELAGFLGVTPEIARGMVERKEIPSVQVGRRRRVDPVDAAVYVLAGREGCTVEEYWRRHGETTMERAMKYAKALRAA